VTGEPKSASPSLRNLLQGTRKGDSQAVERLCAYIRPLLRTWAHGRLPAESRGIKDTDDVVQDVLVRVLANLQMFSYSGDGSFLAYVRKAAWNQILDERRRVRARPRQVELDDNHRDLQPSPLDDSVLREFMDLYESALEALPQEDQVLIVARLELGFPYQEIARNTGHPTADAVRMAVSRAVRRLAGTMGSA
jgi:RNA polymerase sigma-70 factor, ECF subfamily